jgi:hypothetical protein
MQLSSNERVQHGSSCRTGQRDRNIGVKVTIEVKMTANGFYATFKLAAMAEVITVGGMTCLISSLVFGCDWEPRLHRLNLDSSHCNFGLCITVRY